VHQDQRPQQGQDAPPAHLQATAGVLARWTPLAKLRHPLVAVVELGFVSLAVEDSRSGKLPPHLLTQWRLTVNCCVDEFHQSSLDCQCHHCCGSCCSCCLAVATEHHRGGHAHSCCCCWCCGCCDGMAGSLWGYLLGCWLHRQKQRGQSMRVVGFVLLGMPAKAVWIAAGCDQTILERSHTAEDH